MDFFEELGMRTKIERGERVFPLSDHSSDVIRTLEEEMKRLGVKICLNTSVKKIEAKDGHFTGVVLSDGKKVSGDACVVATEALLSVLQVLPGTATGLQKNWDLKLTDCLPSLVPMETQEDWVPELQGLSLPKCKCGYQRR